MKSRSKNPESPAEQIASRISFEPGDKRSFWRDTFPDSPLLIILFIIFGLACVKWFLVPGLVLIFAVCAYAIGRSLGHSKARNDWRRGKWGH